MLQTGKTNMHAVEQEVNTSAQKKKQDAVDQACKDGLVEKQVALCNHRKIREHTSQAQEQGVASNNLLKTSNNTQANATYRGILDTLKLKFSE